MNKKKLSKKVENIFYAVAVKTTKFPCTGLGGQPKMPEHLKKMTKEK